jgi:hypothetical protein
MPTYRVTGGPDGTAGINYKDKRVEPGDEVTDLPRESIKWLKEQGYIEIVGDTTADSVPVIDAPLEPVAEVAP